MFLLFLLHSMGIALFRLTGAICRDETIASTGGVRAPYRVFMPCSWRVTLWWKDAAALPCEDQGPRVVEGGS